VPCRRSRLVRSSSTRSGSWTLLSLVSITFIFTTTRAQGRVGGAGVDVSNNDHHSGLLAVVVLHQSLLVLVLVLVLVVES
jgi:hypothetical protein